jgi:hypothetical protein
MSQSHRNAGRGTFRREIDPQSDSTKHGQFDWLSAPTVATQVQIDAAGVYKQQDFHAAIVWVMVTSGKSDKELAHLCGVDAATFSRIKSGQAHVPTSRIPEIMEGCENCGSMFWLINRMGWDPQSLRRLLSDVERELEQVKAELAEERREKALMAKLWKETR